MEFQIWLRRVERILKQQQDVVQPVINRALLSLPRHKHIKFISQTAIHEFKCGVPDRGRSMFEGILREYPKRTDLWSVYLDQVKFLFATWCLSSFIVWLLSGLHSCVQLGRRFDLEKWIWYVHCLRGQSVWASQLKRWKYVQVIYHPYKIIFWPCALL